MSTRHKKCDETKPHCLRCQKSRIECPGYTYVQDPNKPNRKPRTIPAPRNVVGHNRGGTQEVAPAANTEGYALVTSEVSYNVVAASKVASIGVTPGATDISNHLALSSSFSGSPQYPSIDYGTSHELANPSPLLMLPGASTAILITSSQPSLPATTINVNQRRDLKQQCPTSSVPDIPVPMDPDWPLPDSEQRDDATMHEDDKNEDAIGFIRLGPVMDRTIESNALPFVLQGYAAWASRMALEPTKVTRVARDFVFGHFEDGEHSRWIIALLANVGSRIGGVEFAEGTHRPMVSALQFAVRQRLVAVKSHPNPESSALVKVLNSVTETIIIHFYASPVGEAMTLRQEVAPIFRQLCPEPDDSPVDLLWLLQHPLGCLRHYAELDIIFSVVSDMPTLFRYKLVSPGSQPFDSSLSAPATQSDGVVQWLRGVPNPLLFIFAHMKAMRENGVMPSEEMVALLEQDIRELPPFNGSSSERFLTIMRSVVQECWRQTAYIYLYMAVCGDPPNTPRVKGAFKRYIKLLTGTKPGRLPDEFLLLTFSLVSPAAERQRDREVIRQRALGLYPRDQSYFATAFIISVMNAVWAHADAEGRPAMWSDMTASRKQVLGA